MVCCNGTCCTSCSVTLFDLGIRSCGMNTLFGGKDFNCVDCDDCNGEKFPLTCSSANAVAQNSQNSQNESIVINKSFSDTQIYQKKRKYIKEEIKKLTEFITFIEPYNSNIQYFVELDYEGFLRLNHNLSILNLTQFQKDILIKRLVSSVTNINNININYRIFIKLNQNKINYEGKENLIYELINKNINNFILNVLVNSALMPIMSNLNFDEIFEILYAYIICYMNLLKLIIINASYSSILKVLNCDVEYNCDNINNGNFCCSSCEKNNNKKCCNSCEKK